MVGFILRLIVSAFLSADSSSAGADFTFPVPIPWEIASMTFFWVGFGLWSSARMYGKFYGFF